MGFMFLPAVLAALGLVGLVQTRSSVQTSEFATQRTRMVDEQIAARGVRNRAVLDAMRAVPRHEFVPETYRNSAYADTPLPIGLDQTISQPYIVALMTELVEPKPEHRILEVGTGSGYQAAVISRIVKEVYSIEIIPQLAQSATERLKRLGYTNITVREGDGYQGWPDRAPFDGILVTAGATEVPKPLIDQLKPGGRMIIPVGSTAGSQVLKVIEKRADGSIRTEEVIPVRFVPLRRN
jgi:protein-L-isoaspartate(D-aspartate) O-methyltransferase